MIFSFIGYYIKEGFENLFKNKKSTFASAVTMFCTLFVFGIFMLVSVNTKEMVKKLEADQGMQVFIKDEVSKEEAVQIGDDIKKIDGVNTVQFKSSQDALEDLKVMFKDNKTIIEGYEDQPDFLPRSYIVKLTELNKLNDVIRNIENVEGVDTIKSQQESISIIVNASKIINVFTGVITLILVVVSVLIISNTIKLTVFARRKEISIMKYVGATNGFVKGPFLVEGIFIGIISTILVMIVLAISYEASTATIAQAIADTKVKHQQSGIGITIMPFSQIMPQLTLLFLGLSMGLGIIGSTISMKRYLEV